MGERRPPAPPPASVTRSLRPGSARAAVAELVQLFPRSLFEDALPPIALRSQVYSLVPDRTAADRQLVSGVGATDGSRFPASRALPRVPITQTLSGSAGARRAGGVRSLCAGPCGAKGNAPDPVKRPSGSRDHATSWKWKSDSFGGNGVLGHSWSLTARGMQAGVRAAGLGRQCCFCLNTEGDELEENVNQERERCVAWIGGSE